MLKALASSGSAAAPAAPAAAPPAGGHGAPPSGAEGRKVGGKYVKRWWENGRWNYDYGDGGAQHHSAGFGHHADPKREHAHALPDDHKPHPAGAEADYHAAHARAFAPGAVHQVPHPSAERAGEHLVVSALPGGQINVREGNGRSRDFKNHAEYERWHLGAQAGAKTIHDAQGVPFAHIAPRVGEVKGGKLQPREDLGTPAMQKKAWVVKYNPAHPNAPQGIERNSEFATTREGAERKVAKRFSHIARFAQGEHSVQAPVKEGYSKEGAGSIDDIESKLKWRQSTQPYRRGKPELAVSPEERDALIQQVAHVYTLFLMKEGDRLLDSYAAKIPSLADPKVKAHVLTELFGVEPGTARTGAVVPSPGSGQSSLHRMIGSALDNFDPTMVNAQGETRKLKGYLTNPNGPLASAVRRDLQANLPRILGTAQKQQAPEGAPDPTASIPSQAPTPEQALEERSAGPYTDESTTTDPSVWQQRQASNFATMAKENPQVPPDLLEQAHDVLRHATSPERIEQIIGQLNGLDRKFPLAGGRRWSDYIADFGKGLSLAAAIVGEEIAKAQGGFVMRDKGVDPTHVYSHREGTEDHPRYYFRDPSGNYVRYTNAPSGHPDEADHGGEAAVHFAEPDAQKAPQFFSPDGRKLTRAPYPGAEVQWNRNYHAEDPENLWFGRWVNPQTGAHEYTYLDADIRGIPELLIHQQNCLTDVRIPILRAYVKRLSSSPHLKDRVTALGLALVDQGRMRLQELGALKVEDVEEGGGLWRIGHRFIFADRRARSLLTLLTRGRHPEEPFLAAPLVQMDGDFDTDKIRRVGPHYLEGILEQLGLSGAALQVYHATQCFSREVQRILYEGCTPWEVAQEYATAYVAAEMGYDLRQELELERVLPLVREMLVDPIAVEVLERNARAASLCNGDPRLLTLPPKQVTFVALDLNTRTADEQDFSAWLHQYPAHTHARIAMPVMPQDAPSVRP